MADAPGGSSSIEPRVRTVLLALAVVAVPTYFAVFPGSADWDWKIRAGILGCWLLLAAGVGAAATRLDDRVAEYVGAQLDKRASARSLAARVAIRSVIACAPPKLAKYEWRLYLYDDELKRLLPSYETSSGNVEQATPWPVGKGATGRCYQIGETVIVRGAECSDGTYGLTPEQQQKYRDLAVVAAVPLRTATRQVIGVLTASSTDDDGSLTAPDGQDWHLETAKVVERILIDILKYAKD